LPLARYSPEGFTNELNLIGSVYHPPSNGTNRVLDVTNGIVVLTGGNLNQALTNPVVLNANNRVTSSNKTSLNIVLSTGSFRGNAPGPVAGKTISFRGALLQKENRGTGFFLGTNQSGKVYFGP
jgi:hypothetical protein